MKKNFYSLIEILIGLLLLSTVTTFVFRTQVQLWYGYRQNIEREKALWRKKMAHQKCLLSLGKALPQKDSFSFEGGLLSFCFENGQSPQPRLSGKIRAQIFLQEGALHLHRLPLSPEAEPSLASCEVLIEGLQSWSCSFYNRDQSWTEEQRASLPPALMRMHLLFETGESWSFPFVFPEPMSKSLGDS